MRGANLLDASKLGRGVSATAWLASGLVKRTLIVCACCRVFCVMCVQVHEKIRANPMATKKERKAPAGEKKRWKTPKSSYETKKANLKAKLAALMEDDE